MQRTMHCGVRIGEDSRKHWITAENIEIVKVWRGRMICKGGNALRRFRIQKELKYFGNVFSAENRINKKL